MPICELPHLSTSFLPCRSTGPLRQTVTSSRSSSKAARLAMCRYCVNYSRFSLPDSVSAARCVKVTVRIFPLPAGVKWLSCPTERCRLQFYRGPFISRLMVWMAYEILFAAWDRSFPSRLLLSHRNWFATSCWKNYIRPYSCSKIQSFCSKTTWVAYKDCI